ncbi:MAG: hypothetical protein MJA83_17895 [Gammaproteobacteria bacterium]|nr:hypothetical protein [Gammaproteobacteria bacterium]
MRGSVTRPDYKSFVPGNFPSEDEFDLCELKFDGWFSRLDLHGKQWSLWSRSSRLIGSGSLNLSYPEVSLYGEYLFGTEWSKNRPDLYKRIAIFGADRIFGLSLEGRAEYDVYSEISSLIKYYLLQEDILGGLFQVPRFHISNAPSVWESKVLGEDYEGLIFKNSQASWGSPFGRMKRQVTMDYVCMGFEDSDSDTYQGWGVASVVGGLFVDGKLQQVCRVSGLTDELRGDFFINREHYVGTVFEATGKKVSKRGSLRHPNFIRWRDDKLPELCTWPR